MARAWAGVKPSAGVWGWRKSPTTKKRLDRRQSSRTGVPRWSILVWHHYGDGGLRVVHVQRAAMAISLTSCGRWLSLRT
jgi:hypothetical protein